MIQIYAQMTKDGKILVVTLDKWTGHIFWEKDALVAKLEQVTTASIPRGHLGEKKIYFPEHANVSAPPPPPSSSWPSP